MFMISGLSCLCVSVFVHACVCNVCVCVCVCVCVRVWCVFVYRYDVTNWATTHPGGSSILKLFHKKDVTGNVSRVCVCVCMCVRMCMCVVSIS